MKKPCMAAAPNKDQRATIQNEIACMRPQSTITVWIRKGTIIAVLVSDMQSKASVDETEASALH
jgi:hypothetical protein